MSIKNTDKLGYKVIVSGLVQGVGFRYFTAKEANKLALSGHAKNLSDGTVEVLVYGKEAQLLLLLTWLEIGPTTASVSRINIKEVAYVHTTSFSCL